MITFYPGIFIKTLENQMTRAKNRKFHPKPKSVAVNGWISQKLARKTSNFLILLDIKEFFDVVGIAGGSREI